MIPKSNQIKSKGKLCRWIFNRLWSDGKEVSPTLIGRQDGDESPNERSWHASAVTCLSCGMWDIDSTRRRLSDVFL